MRCTRRTYSRACQSPRTRAPSSPESGRTARCTCRRQCPAHATSVNAPDDSQQGEGQGERWRAPPQECSRRAGGVQPASQLGALKCRVTLKCKMQRQLRVRASLGWVGCSRASLYRTPAPGRYLAATLSPGNQSTGLSARPSASTTGGPRDIFSVSLMLEAATSSKKAR